MKSRFIVTAGMLLLSTAMSAFAQQNAEHGGTPTWRLGVGAISKTSVYAGEDSDIKAVPLLNYESDTFFFRAISGGYHLLDQDGLKLDATLGLRLNGVNKEDFGVAELAAKGINRNLLEDRDNGLDLGIAASFSGHMGEVELALKMDVSGASKGFEASAKYGYPIQFGATSITPNVSISHYSKKFANYYYGTLDAEVDRGVVNYKPGSTVIPSIGVAVRRPFADNWMLMGNLSYSALPSRITDSPIVDKDTSGVTSVFFGISRGF
tara:strand:- start:110594 stop:111388 length:795 start_codon:yes stop_codon:yes gene_type:complete